jgi:dGTPase
MLMTRAALHSKEKRTLAPYALRSANSKGREHSEAEAQHRTAFQRDRDRILHTTAFRRLEYKTQVFVNTEGDYYRTRLTHTLEVAQLGRSIARTLAANEDLIEAICLAHDLGHPPFGHSGERALNRLLTGHGGFDHNKQSLRIVTEIEKRYPDFAGLNLTWEVREAIVKHETEYDVSDARNFNPELRGHLEAQIANAADELAYTAHDLDDGLRSGLLHPRQLDGIALCDRVRKSIKWEANHFDELTRHRMIRRVIGLETRDLVAVTSANIDLSGASVPIDIQKLDHNVVGWSPSFAMENQQLRDFLRENLYCHSRVELMSARADKIIGDLYNSYTKHPDMLPASSAEHIQTRGLERTVCDYIAGMTDRFALDEHARLHVGSAHVQNTKVSI